MFFQVEEMVTNLQSKQENLLSKNKNKVYYGIVDVILHFNNPLLNLNV